jgi:hypothetical protein
MSKLILKNKSGKIIECRTIYNTFTQTYFYLTVNYYLLLFTCSVAICEMCMFICSGSIEVNDFKELYTDC